MENLNKYIKEALVNHKVKKRENKYHPKTKDELIECIKTELNNDNTDLNCIDTSEIKDMLNLFNQNIDDSIKLTKEQQEKLDVSDWNVSNVKDMNCMFKGCNKFNSDLSKWDVSNVMFTNHMFYNCEQFNSDLSNWDVSNLIFTNYMFYNCEQFNSDLSKWNIFTIRSMRHMFDGCKQFNFDLSNWDVSNVGNISHMFDGSGLEGNEPSWYKK